MLENLSLLDSQVVFHFDKVFCPLSMTACLATWASPAHNLALCHLPDDDYLSNSSRLNLPPSPVRALVSSHLTSQLCTLSCRNSHPDDSCLPRARLMEPPEVGALHTEYFSAGICEKLEEFWTLSLSELLIWSIRAASHYPQGISVCDKNCECIMGWG